MTNDITIKSGQTVHVTIDDEAAAPLPPSAISYEVPAALQGQLTIAADTTGFNLTASAGASAAATAVTFTYKGGGTTLTIDLNITLGELAVGPLQYTSP